MPFGGYSRVGFVDHLGADVERLEQIGRTDHTHAVGKAFSAPRCIATVHVELRRAGGQLHLGGQREECSGGGAHGVDDGCRHAMAHHFEEAHTAAGIVEFGTDDCPVAPRRDVDRRNQAVCHGQPPTSERPTISFMISVVPP